MSEPLPNPGLTSPGVYQLAPVPRPWPALPAQADGLSDPEVETIAETLFHLLPKGAAWRSPDAASFDSDSLLGNFWRAIAGSLAETYRRLFGLTAESTASTLNQSLADWERDFGLPDPCFGFDQSRTQRLRALLMRVRSAGTITPADFVNLAAAVGYVVTIAEPQVFITGFSSTGLGQGTGSAANFFWIVKVSGRSSKSFETGLGKSQTGIDPLLDVAQATDLECLFRALAPAWTRVIFDYS